MKRAASCSERSIILSACHRAFVDRELIGQEPSVAWLIEMRSEWQVVFLLAAVVQTGGLVMYLALASGERQSWD